MRLPTQFFPHTHPGPNQANHQTKGDATDA
ncbi:hypothetical protein SAMN05443377_10872 [Propionibacterium cyclohexanicum]|uniref:Uncharacterized protein n=1 Tax=Propionibacterium cyclohexanicum TaxID=64702 RepID=A0A1H9RNU0_9ACTN|nr:hypothetical protein SAMN05443377_10872 [Propionibacterium cyclohexanicum]